MMSNGQNMMFYELPMMSPEHNSMPTMNTAEMFDNMWCSSDSGVSGDRSPAQPTSPLLDEIQCQWDPVDASILEANLFNSNRNLRFEDDLDLFSFANGLVTEDEIEQLNFPDNVSENSSSSSTITSYSIPSSPEHFSDDMNPSTFTDNYMYPRTLTDGNISSCIASCGNFSKKIKKTTRRQRKQKLENSSDRAISIIRSGDISSPANSIQNISTVNGLNTLTPTEKNASSILYSNIKWSELDDTDQRCLVEGIDTIISQSLGVREQLDVKAIMKPHIDDSSSQDANLNNFTLLDDEKLSAVRRYLKSLENLQTNTKPNHRQRNKTTEKKPKKKSKVKNLLVKDRSVNLLKSNSVKAKKKNKNLSKYNDNQSEKLEENLSWNKLKAEKSLNYKFISNNVTANKETQPKNNPLEAIDSKSSNIGVNMTISQPSISWQQRKKPIKSKRTTPEIYEPKETCADDHKQNFKGKPRKDYKETKNTNTKTPTKNSRNIKQEHRSDFVLSRARSRKEYRQLIKEKRSGLFLQEQVVSLSTNVGNPGKVAHQNPSDHDTDDDVDILG